MVELTAQRARKLVSYDPDTGTFRWLQDVWGGIKKSVHMRRAGEMAGTQRPDGRRVLRLDGRLYMAYRVAWLIETGSWPEGEIDHIDGDRENDRFANLRSVTRPVNQQNLRRAQRTKRSTTYLGVFPNKPGRAMPWRACIGVNGKSHLIGVYLTEEEAYAAYLEAKRRLHEGCTL